MSGYDKSPDYSGPEPHKHTLIIAALIFAALLVIVWYGGLLGIIRTFAQAL